MPTIQALLAAARRKLAAAAVDDPGGQAAALLAHVLAWPPARLLAESRTELAAWDLDAAAAQARFTDLVDRRARRCPLQYLLGAAEFCDLAFTVTPAVLIPRPETEGVIARALARPLPPAPRIADLGTGSGCIAVTLAARLPAARVTAVDLDPAALAVARENAARHRVGDRIDWVQGDFLEALKAPDRPEAGYHLLCSNPPYVPESDLATLQAEVRDWEPVQALAGGPDGAAFYRRMAAAGRRYLAPGGCVIMEIGFGQAETVQALFAGAGWRARVHPDFRGIPRVLEAVPAAEGEEAGQTRERRWID